MADKRLTENLNETYLPGEGRDMQFLRCFTLIALLPLWAGYAFALYRGNHSNLSGYSLLILALSLMNGNALFGRETLENKALNLIAKLEGILFFVWVIITIIQLLLK